MYVWKNESRRDRRARPRPSRGTGAGAVRVVAVADSRQRILDRVRAARSAAADAEEHEVRVRTKHVAAAMTAYLLTPHGKDELSAVTVALRRQQEEAQRVLQQTQRDAEKAADAFRLEALEAQKSLSPEERLEVDRARNTRTAKQIAQDDKVERAGRATAAAEVAKAKNDDLRRVFEMFDADARGSIDVEELGNLLRELCVPVESEEALGALMEELDLDGSGEIEFPEFTAWYESHAAKMQSGGLRSRFGTAALAVQRMGNVLGGATAMSEAKRIMVACATHDAEQQARLIFRQSRPVDDSVKHADVPSLEMLRTEVQREVGVDLAAEKRFSCVRAVIGRPSLDGGTVTFSDNWARKYRARRLQYSLDLWPQPPLAPDLVPPAWMNSGKPSLADPDGAAGDARALGALVAGFDPTKGEKGGHFKPNAVLQMGGRAFLHGRLSTEADARARIERGQSDGLQRTESMAQAIVALRSDVKTDDESRDVVLVPAGKLTGTAKFTWRSDMLPKPRLGVTVEGEFNGYQPLRLQPSRSKYDEYEYVLELPPGTYAYRYRVDDEVRLDKRAPQKNVGSQRCNVIRVLAYHRFEGEARPARHAALTVDLGGHALGDDGVWALAAAMGRGGGGSLTELCLPSNGISFDGCAALMAAIASGATPQLRRLDVSKNKIGAEGGRAITQHLLSAVHEVEEDTKVRKRPSRKPLKKRPLPAPLAELNLSQCGLADDGACHIAAGLVGHGTLVRLDLNENNIGELGCAGLAKALLGNGVLAHLSLAANRVDSHGAGHLARAVRLSGALLSLELGNNPLIGAVGAKHLGEALAGGSADLLSRLEAEAPLARTERFRVTLQSLGEDGVGSDDDDGTAPQAKGPRRGRGKSARGGALEHLGLAECDVMRGRNVAGVCALASGLERGGALTSLDLSRCDMSDFGASELAQALRGALGRSRLVVLRLQGNSSLSPRWADRDSYVKLTHQGTIADDPIFNPDDDTTQSSTRTTTTQSSKSRGTADRHNLVPTIATSLELNRRDVARDAKERGEPVRGSRASLSLDEGSVSSLDNDSASAVSMVSMASVRRGSAPPEKKRSKLLTVPPAPAADKATGRLEGEWTNGWLAQEDRVEAKAARAEAVARADEASRQRLEEDAVDAACAAAGAATWLALLQPPDGPKLLAAVVAELREAGALAKKVAAAAPKRKVDTRAVAHATLAVVDDVESVSTLATDQLETKVAAQTPRSFAALLAEAVVPRGKVTLAVDAKTDSGPAPAEAVVAGRRAPRRGAVVDPAAAHLRAVFMRVDVDDSGGIDASELPALLSRLGWKHMSKKALQEMMGKIDGNSSGAIDFQELCSWYFTGGRKEIRNAKRRPAFFQGGEGDAVELNADALKQLVAEARAAAQVSARAAYRSRFPTRGNCVCAVCGVAALDVGAAAKHYDAATATREISAHVIWRKKAAANFRRAQMLDRARASVARQARGKEGRSTSTAAGNVAANADEVSSQFPVLLVYHPEVQHFIDLQTYDIPDSLLGRPTGALTLHASAVFCVGDGHGNAECAGAGAEWLRILMPPHVERAWAPDAARSALMAAEAVAAARHGASLRELFVDGGEERAPLRRAVVWLRNRSLEYAHGKKSVLVPLRPGPTPLDRSEADLRKDIELGICDVGGKKLKVKPPSKPPSKLATLLRAATFQTGAARRDVEKRAEAAHLKRLKILGEHAEYVVDTRSLRSGPQIVLWARPRWYRVAPALHRRTRLKVRAVPEAYAHVLGDVGWGDAILAYGRGGDWLIGAFGDRDNAWFLEKSPRRALLHLVGSTVQLKTLRARGVSPQTIELGATAKGTIVSQAPARLQAKGNALRAEDEDVDDADLERLGAPDDKGDADG